jgi:hypothetical protein
MFKTREVLLFDINRSVAAGNFTEASISELKKSGFWKMQMDMDAKYRAIY